MKRSLRKNIGRTQLHALEFSSFSHEVQSRRRWHLQLKQAIVRRAAAAQTIINYLTGVLRENVCALFAVSTASSAFQLIAPLKILSIEHTAAGDLYNTDIKMLSERNSVYVCVRLMHAAAAARTFSCPGAFLAPAAVTFIPR
jgi:hypothetical protein